MSLKATVDNHHRPVGIVLALAAIVVPLWLAWALLGWRERRKISRPKPTPAAQRKQ